MVLKESRNHVGSYQASYISLCCTVQYGVESGLANCQADQFHPGPRTAAPASARSRKPTNATLSTVLIIMNKHN